MGKIIRYKSEEGFYIAPLRKGGWGIFHNDRRCLDAMGQTGLGARFQTPTDAARAIQAAKAFDVLEGIEA